MSVLVALGIVTGCIGAAVGTAIRSVKLAALSLAVLIVCMGLAAFATSSAA